MLRTPVAAGLSGEHMAQQPAFIFDMDGTLIDSMPFHIQAWTDMLTGLGVQTTPEAFLRQTGGKTNRQILREIFGGALTETETVSHIKRKEALYRSLYRPHLKPIDGLLPFLNESQRLHIPMAVATSAGKTNRDFVLQGLAIEAYFSVVVGVEEIREGKPDPEIFLKAAEKLAVPPADCLVFEDALAGIEAAYRAGMKAVALTTSADGGTLQNLPGVIQTAKDFTSLSPQSLLAAWGRL
jgi:beta-phosphoglucomutase family hydrolase